MDSLREGTNSQALAGLRVLDLGQEIAGPYCARLLGDQGADVVKVEPPTVGDPSRGMEPFVGDEPHPEKSLHFLYLNYNKRSITLDLTDKSGRDALLDLVRRADIVVENFEASYLPSLGLGYESFAAVNPRIIVTSITNFGQSGPRRDWRGNDLINYALSGCMYISGTARREPLKPGQCQSGYAGGFAGVIPTIAALYMREMTGEGQHVDVAIAESLASTLVMMVPYYTYMGETQRRRDDAGGAYGNCTEVRDGWIIPHATRSRDWNEFCDVLESSPLADPKFASPKGKIAYAEELDRLLHEALMKLNRFDLFHRANRKRLLFGVVQTPEDLANCDQLAARGFFDEADHPIAGRLRYPGRTFETTEGGFSFCRRPPLLGEHNEEILRGELGYGAAELEAVARSATI